jgi:hypothetical protein
MSDEKESGEKGNGLESISEVRFEGDRDAFLRDMRDPKRRIALVKAVLAAIGRTAESGEAAVMQANIETGEVEQIDPEGMDFLAHRFGGLDHESGPVLPPDVAELLSKRPTRAVPSREDIAAFNERPALQVGDLVRWKPGQQDAPWPAEDGTARVSQIVTPPIRMGENSSEACAAEVLDIALCYVVEESTPPRRVHEFLFDSRRFELVKE